MIEVQCTSCHTRYRIDERVLPEGIPTFKCSRCGHVFTCEPRKSRSSGQHEALKPPPHREAEAPADPSFSHMADETQTHQTQPDGQFPNDEAAAQQDASGLSQVPRSDASVPQRASESASNEQRRPDASKRHEQASRSEARSAFTDSDSGEPNRQPPPEPPPRVAAEEARKFYSRLFTGNDADSSSGDNLSFDFADEEREPQPPKITRRSRRQTSPSPTAAVEGGRWQVGDKEFTPAASIGEKAFRDDAFDNELSRGPRTHIGRPRRKKPGFLDEDEFVDEEVAPIYNRAITHSSRFFILLIFLVALGFGALTLLIHSAPATTSSVLSFLPLVGDRFTIPTTPAKLVALRDVNAVYQLGKGSSKALIISGTAENVGTEPLHLVQLSAALRDPRRRLVASGSAYCGNSVSLGMVSQMTPREIDFLQKLEPAKNFVLEPSASCRFVIVFTNPSATAQSYEVSVSQAVPGRAPNTEESES
jgi:predicted Zn finger-like uncharacterized protein